MVDISDIYAHLYEYLSDHYGDIIKDIVRTANKADAMYDLEKDPYLHDLSMISLLSVDIYAKKKYVEHLVDKLRSESGHQTQPENKNSKSQAAPKKPKEQKGKQQPARSTDTKTVKKA